MSNRHPNRRRARKHAQRLKARRLQPCVLCGGDKGPIQYDAPHDHPLAFSVEHIKSVETHPHLQFDPNNMAPSHRHCNSAQGSKIRANHNLDRNLGPRSRNW